MSLSLSFARSASVCLSVSSWLARTRFPALPTSPTAPTIAPVLVYNKGCSARKTQPAVLEIFSASKNQWQEPVFFVRQQYSCNFCNHQRSNYQRRPLRDLAPRTPSHHPHFPTFHTTSHSRPHTTTTQTSTAEQRVTWVTAPRRFPPCLPHTFLRLLPVGCSCAALASWLARKQAPGERPSPLCECVFSLPLRTRSFKADLVFVGGVGVV